MGFEFFGKLLAAIFNGAIILYWVVTALLLFGIARSKWPRWVKAVVGLMVTGVLIGWPVRNEMLLRQQEDAARQRLAKAEAIFNERCKNAGEKIYRTAEGVEGIYLAKVRNSKDFDTTNQNTDDPYGALGDFRGDDFIISFLMGRATQGNLSFFDSDKPGYRYVEATDSHDSTRYRYIGEMRLPEDRPNGTPRMQFRKEAASGPKPRYAVDLIDLTTPEERTLWIAGGAIRIIDLEINQVMAERIGYMVDKGLGTTGGGRQPWAHAGEWSCPRPIATREFVEKVLKIREN